MNIKISQITKEDIKKYEIKKFLFHMIKTCYNSDYVPEYHYDIIDLEKYYINPEKSNFFIAVDTDKDEVIGTSAIRNYDKDYEIKGHTYSKEDTASIYRVFVNSNYRHSKIGTKLVEKIEEFCESVNYNKIYLHTQKDSYGALAFWKHNNYEITCNTHDELGTIHMEKIIQT